MVSPHRRADRREADDAEGEGCSRRRDGGGRSGDAQGARGAGLPRFRARAARAGAVVVDNSSAFRMDADVPLVVPEVNPHAVELAVKPGGRRIVATPNCSTIQLVVVLKPLHDAAGLERVVVSTYQSVSGAGQKGIDELDKQARALFN